MQIIDYLEVHAGTTFLYEIQKDQFKDVDDDILTCNIL
jgi:hypothetical protein